MGWRKYLRIVLLGLLVSGFGTVRAGDLDAVRQAGVLRHLGVPYANFVTGSGDGLDVELMRGFARHLGVKYRFVQTDWAQAFGDLTGRHARREGDRAQLLEATPVRGDVLANGVTILRWRSELVDFSDPTFPSGVWLVARAHSTVHPITPSGNLDSDIARVKKLMKGKSVLALENTCLDPGLYGIEKTGARLKLANSKVQLNEMAPAVLKGEAETTLLDVPDALIALEKWPGQLKVIGPVSGRQEMAVAFPKTAPKLRAAFNQYLRTIQQDGSYLKLVKRYYPGVLDHYSAFFADR
ncbi:MAG: transporter substrate-binding domain-containing protein [Pseudomonadota bacterium]